MSARERLDVLIAHRRAVDDLPAASKDAVLRLEEAGFVVGYVKKTTEMWSVERGRSLIWLDVGHTIRYTEDPSDDDYELLLDVVEVVEGPARRAWMKDRLMEPR
jgi:septum formation topological specificity factor MinE